MATFNVSSAQEARKLADEYSGLAAQIDKFVADATEASAKSGKLQINRMQEVLERDIQGVANVAEDLSGLVRSIMECIESMTVYAEGIEAQLASSDTTFRSE